MNNSTRTKWLRRKHRIAKRLRPRKFGARARPMLTARNIHYDLADRTRAIGHGGIGSVHLLARKVGLIDAIDRALELFKAHLPYHESDHVLNIAYNVMCGGDCLQDIELLRNDEAHLDALGASRIPAPTTAGDFCRRFESAEQVNALQETINSVRVGVWKRQPPEFFERAIIDVDGTIAPTDGECKQGMDISYDGQWGYHPLVVSLANTREPLYLHNRSANRPSHEDAAEYLERAIVLCREAGFRSILMRGDTDFSQTAYLDGWDDLHNDQGQRFVRFLFGIDAMANLKALAEPLPRSAWKPLARPPRYEVATEERAKPHNVKEQVIAERGFEHLRLRTEHVAEIKYRPVACDRDYRLIIWAYMVMASLAWTLKAWWGLMLPEAQGKGHPREARRQQKQDVVRMEFKRFVASIVRLPCQIVRTGRRLIYRMLSYSPWQEPLLAGVAAWRTRTQC